MRAIILLLAAALCCGSAHALVPHEINYQGNLTNPGGTPGNATVPMVLNLYNVPTGGAALYTETQTVTVTNGVFNVLIGSVTALALPFDVPYYLGIMVGADPEMTPRQPVAASAYAIRSASAEALAVTATVPGSQISGTIPVAAVPAGSTSYIQNSTALQSTSNFNISGNGILGGNLTTTGSVGIGTASFLRSSSLQFGSIVDAAFAVSPSDGTPNAGYIRFGDQTGWKLHFARSRNSSGGALNTGTAGALMTLQDNGNVGIGTSSPQASLDVRGNVKLGNTGQFFAPAGEENLRIIRGALDLSGNIDFGSGFTVTHPALAVYLINFTTPFSGIPVVTANCRNFFTTCYVRVIDSNPSEISDPNRQVQLSPTDKDGNPAASQIEFTAIGPR